MGRNTTLKILAVDDFEEIRHYISDFFTRRGHFVFTADSAENALPIIKEIRPDIVLLDMNLPNMSGLAFLRLVRNFNTEIKVIMVSGYNFDSEQVKEMRELGVFEVLEKPVGIDKLDEAIKKAFIPVQ